MRAIDALRLNSIKQHGKTKELIGTMRAIPVTKMDVKITNQSKVSKNQSRFTASAFTNIATAKMRSR